MLPGFSHSKVPLNLASRLAYCGIRVNRSGSCGGGLVELQALLAVGPHEAKSGPCRVSTLQRHAEVCVPRLLNALIVTNQQFLGRAASQHGLLFRARYWLDQFFALMEKYPRYLSYEQRHALISACAS